MNNEGPNTRYQLLVLPQGMANSPTMCQIYVGKTISQIRQNYNELHCLHYMDGILLAHREQETLLRVFDIIKTLQKWGLHVAPEKVKTPALLPF